MENAIMIAKILWPILALFALSLLLNPGMYQKMIKEFEKSSSWMVMGGLLSALVGILIVGSYRVWSFDWTLIVTLIGYLSLLKWVTLLLFPSYIFKLSDKVLAMDLWHIVYAVIYAILAIVLLWGVYGG